MEGLKIGSKESSLEKVVLDPLELSLISRGQGVEVITQRIEAGRMVYLYPSDNPDAFEFYFILSGEITFEDQGVNCTLGTEDYFSAEGLKETIFFKVISEVKLLCIFTEQTFFHISKEINSLYEIAKQVELKDRYTFKHSDRVANYSMRIAKKLKLNRSQLDNLNIAASLHDIGKINVPEEILNKPGRLTDEEFAIIKKHPGDGAEMIKGTYYEEIHPIIEQHHERLNGTGYPQGLKGDEISLEARIIAVSDTFDAMTEDRAYRKAFNAQFALDELKKLSGTHYDPQVVKAFEEVLIEEGLVGKQDSENTG
ncbi:HD-GYP domain-containing protein [Bacillus sp. SG-1]|uniref:HD-GYP domain-containing protein n=1 Tax=Bacillus sp. SG-1 TaxID=161544 RepID=UPI0001544395|nr:HD-GYP domain-containing protein [Bacillus sp. SG-1]EDL65437.1 HDIG domain protein [Bacillus sp. SG-1]